jgi:hypothetical protein
MILTDTESFFLRCHKKITYFYLRCPGLKYLKENSILFVFISHSSETLACTEF